MARCLPREALEQTYSLNFALESCAAPPKPITPAGRKAEKGLLLGLSYTGQDPPGFAKVCYGFKMNREYSCATTS
jgi:hypothetical protein